jgi:peptide/nickel transport system substrate-binding protein
MSPSPRRTLRRQVVALALGGAVALGACAAPEPVADSTTVLRTALSADLPPLDPDTYYEAEGLAITSQVYEGLLRYEPDSAELTGQLAESWEVSPDGLTYTFTLRPDVRFADGTDFDSAAMAASFERRTALEGGQAYMLDDVAETETPDPLTFVVRLSQPVAPFLDYLASPYGPVAISPTAVEENAEGDDLAAGWLATRSAGTGPYELTEVVPAQRYVLERNDNYWGEAPAIETVNFAVIPDRGTQLLQLRGGQLDMLLTAPSPRDLAEIEADPDLQIVTAPALLKSLVQVNADSAVFGPIPVREALRDALDVETLTAEGFGESATPSTEFLPRDMLPDGAVPSGRADTPDPDGLTAALEPFQGQSVVVGYYDTRGAQPIATRLQQQLEAAGLDATLRPFTGSQIFALPTDPTQRPDLFVATLNPDAAHPDTWTSIYNEVDAPVNYMGCPSEGADELAALGRREPDPEVSQDLYVQATTAYRDSVCWIDIADVLDVAIASSDISGFGGHQLPWMMATNLATLTRR